MRDDLLETYLNDHLAGSASAVALLKECQSRHADDALGPFFARLLEEVEQDRDVLRDVLARVGGTENAAKKVAGWLSEKASQTKLRYATTAELELLEALDGLALGIEGKRALWSVLGATLGTDDRLGGVDFEGLQRRVERQHAEVEARRVEAARRAFAEAGTATPSSPD